MKSFLNTFRVNHALVSGCLAALLPPALVVSKATWRLVSSLDQILSQWIKTLLFLRICLLNKDIYLNPFFKTINICVKIENVLLRQTWGSVFTFPACKRLRGEGYCGCEASLRDTLTVVVDQSYRVRLSLIIKLNLKDTPRPFIFLSFIQLLNSNILLSSYSTLEKIIVLSQITDRPRNIENTKVSAKSSPNHRHYETLAGSI